MVSNYNTSRPPHWPPGALRASVGEVPTQPQTASVEALPARWWATPHSGTRSHLFSSKTRLSFCGRWSPSRREDQEAERCTECLHREPFDNLELHEISNDLGWWGFYRSGNVYHFFTARSTPSLCGGAWSLGASKRLVVAQACTTCLPEVKRITK